MKKSLKISGIIGLSTIVLSSIMKINHWPGASILLFAGFLIILLAYIPVLLLTIKKEKILKRKMHLTYVGIFTAFILLVSILFKYMHWPYSNFLVFLSWLLMLIFLIMLFSNIMKTEENRMLNLSMLLFFTILFVINVTFTLVPLNNPRLSKFTIESNLEASIKLYDQRVEKTYEVLDTIKDSLRTGEISEIRTKTIEITAKLDQTRDALFSNRAEQEGYIKQLFKQMVITNSIEDNLQGLEKEVAMYREFLLTKTASQPELKSFIESSIQFGFLDGNNDPPVIYNNLQRLIRDIKIAESILLVEIR